MEKQNQIKSTLTRPESIELIRARLDKLSTIGRTRFAEGICEHFNFIDPAGNNQTAGCLKALRKLEKQGWFILPKSKTGSTRQSTAGKRLDEPVAPAEPLPEYVGKIKRLDLIHVTTESHLRIWNTLMIEDHPQGERPLVGRQIRYLIKSEQGWLGGIGFSAAALHLEARDQWIGWDWEARQQSLHHVVNMSRFLIRDGVSCKNLASKILGMAIREFPQHFEARYGYRPLLLESFVDDTHQGTCYKAANWQWLGKTKGRGRQDTKKQSPESIKDIYVYSLVEDFRLKLGLPAHAGLGALAVIDSINGENWAEKEFGGAPLGDKRLSNRLIEIGLEKSNNPGSSYNDAAQGDWPKVKAYYRFIEQADDSAVTLENILLPHRKQTIRRMKAETTVLCVQDGTDINYSRLSSCEGLGQIGSNQTGAISAGLHLHSTMALTTEGVPLGVLMAQCTAPKPKDQKDKRKRENIPIEEKRTFSWIESVRDSMALKEQMPHTQIVHVMDREADFFELFDEQRTRCPRVELLVRAQHDRKTAGKNTLFETLKNSRVKKTITLPIPRQSGREKKSKQKAREKQPARQAKVAIRYKQIELAAPLSHKDKTCLKLWAVHVREYQTPTNAEPVEWFLLTTLEIESVEEALKCVKWYKLRWRIEDWHRVLKSGCGIEKLQHKTAERLKRAIAINMVAAWRIMLMTLLGREAPELPSDILFSDLEMKVLEAYTQKKTWRAQKY